MTLFSIDARTGEPRTGSVFQDAAADEVAAAVDAAVAAAPTLAAAPPALIAALLRAIATAIEDLGDDLLRVADEESALGLVRLTGERGRTMGQLEAFARFVETGEHLDAVIDRRDPEATPPRPDLRRANVAVGPVAVFAASNFPLAFSVAGGDTASALAAGCPVVVKAHPSHPATSELVAGAVAGAVASVGLPSGTFSLLHGASIDVGRGLVAAEGIEAVGFTGSLRAGRALHDLGASRPRPIPVYAEMGSTNPVFVTEAALAAREPEIAAGLAGSFTLGVGQFCTKPGLVIVASAAAAASLAKALASEVAANEPQSMLNGSLRAGLLERLAKTTQVPGVTVVHDGGSGATTVGPFVLTASASVLAEHPEVAEEHFGPVVVVVAADGPAGQLAAARALPGNLTATIHAEADDAVFAAELAAALQHKVGRVVWNGFPTGVAVTDAMVHGGPYPATTASATTSVGLAAIRRFLRPVAWQDAPDALLPPALQDANPWGLARKIDGTWTSAPVAR